MKSRLVTSWNDIEMQDLFFAYRKAKADSFYERSIQTAEAFVTYESDIARRLQRLLSRLRKGYVRKILKEGLFPPKIMAKKLNLEKIHVSGEKRSPHGYFSDSAREFERVKEEYRLTPEFRLIGDFSVEVHILSALWINLIGHKYDSKLLPSAYGSRLRRYRGAEPKPRKLGDYHLEANGSFEPYFEPYKRWRDNGLATIRSELENDRSVIAVTLDFTSFYHNIDPSFLTKTSYLKSIGLQLSDWEHDFTREFVRFLSRWAGATSEKMAQFGCLEAENTTGGIPIGLSIVRVISNAILIQLDKEIENDLMPLYYGRYVDDIFIVLRDTKAITSTGELWDFLRDRLKTLATDDDSDGTLRVDLAGGYAGKTHLLLQAAKQRTFFLEGRPGLDLLENIASEIRRVSSERRLMPLPEQLDQTASARVLSAVSTSADEADTLRRAEGLTVRRLGWSMQLRSVEILARDLKRGEWRAERKRFYNFAHNHVIRPDRILEQLDYIPRLLSLAVALLDWAEARRLVMETLASIENLQRETGDSSYKINGVECYGSISLLWLELKESVLGACREAFIRSLRCGGTSNERGLPTAALKLCDQLGFEADEASILRRALAVREADWAKVSYKEHLRSPDARTQRLPVPEEESLFALYPHGPKLRDFLNRTVLTPAGAVTGRVNRTAGGNEDGVREWSIIPFLFPTRAYTTEEIALYLPDECVFADAAAAVANWAEYVRAVRGVWVTNPPQDMSSMEGESPPVPPPPLPPVDKQAGSIEPLPPTIVQIGRSRKLSPVRLGITSLGVSDATWSRGANGTPDLSAERYKQIANLVNQAVQMRPRPTYLLLPELSLPERWIFTVSSLLQQSGISLIAGVDYQLYRTRKVDSSAVIVLNDDRLGFETTLQIRQRKSFPAPHEEHHLLGDFNLDWKDPTNTQRKPVYDHNGFHFGVLVCSELQNILYRKSFQGWVDSLMILSWNKDLETFSALVDSASLDVHAYIALVNNRRYGDSRVRSPSKHSFKRDVCRVRGGENDHAVVVEIDPRELRKQQTRAKRWPMPSDQYKPAPEGFHMAERRKIVPGT